LKWLLEGLEIIENELTFLNHPQLIRKVNPAALMELVCELFFAQMRVGNPMPSALEYYDRRAKVILECRKKRFFRRWHYFTSRRAAHYPMDSTGSLQITTRRKAHNSSRNKTNGDEWQAGKDAREEMVAFTKEWGSGVKQTTVRSRTTKEVAGMLPYAVSFCPQDAPQNEASMDCERQPLVTANTNLELQAPAPVGTIKYRAGTFVAVLPSRKARNEHSESGAVWFGQLQQDLVLIEEQKPRKKGSKKMRKTKRPQHRYVKVRWLEVAVEQNSSSGGLLYEWHDGDFEGLGDPMELQWDAIGCAVDMSEEKVSDCDNGHIAFRLSEDESSRAFDAVVGSDSSESNESDGVEEQFRIDVVQQKALCTCVCVCVDCCMAGDTPHTESRANESTGECGARAE